MRFLFTSTPGAGHLLPLLPVARAARAAGHEVVVATGASLGRFIAAAGLRHVDIGWSDIESARQTIHELDPLSGRARAEAMWRLAFAGPFAEDIAAGIVDIARDWRPDVIVHEDVDFGAWIGAERLGVPHATIQASAWRPWMRSIVSEPLGRLRVAHGLPPDPDLSGLYGSVFFTTRPRSLRDPGVPLPTGFEELRPHPDDDPDHGPPPAWIARTSPRQRVVVTFGTVNGHRTDLIRPIIDGLGRADLEVVVALGADPASLGEVPANARVERYVPLSQLLPRSDAVVFHGGSGTMLAALSAGLPLVMLPIAADQLDNADRCLAAGVGRVIELSELTPGHALAVVDDVLGDPRYRERAVEVAAEIAAMPGPEAALELIEALV